MIYLNACFLRCLREFEKWSCFEKIGKNEEKWRKIADPESPNIHYYCLTVSNPLLKTTEPNYLSLAGSAKVNVPYGLYLGDCALLTVRLCLTIRA